MTKPFWEETYKLKGVSTFSMNPSKDIAESWHIFPAGATVLDVGCGEGRNSIFLAKHGFIVDAFDISEAGILKAKEIVSQNEVNVNFFVLDLAQYIFKSEYDIILSHGVLHLAEKAERDRFLVQAKAHTSLGGYNAIGVFTNRVPATPDNAPFTKSLFDVGELLDIYSEWEIVTHAEYIFSDSHPNGITHEHAYERVIAKRI